MKLIQSFTFAVIFALLICILPVSAANDSGITIITSEPASGGPGTFTSIGISNNGPDFCVSGIVETSTYTTTIKNKTVTMERKVFTCGDGTGSFTIDVKAGSRPSRPSSWKTVGGGTGSFQAMWGSGSSTASTDPSPSAPKVNTLTGNLHFR